MGVVHAPVEFFRVVDVVGDGVQRLDDHHLPRMVDRLLQRQGCVDVEMRGRKRVTSLERIGPQTFQHSDTQVLAQDVIDGSSASPCIQSTFGHGRRRPGHVWLGTLIMAQHQQPHLVGRNTNVRWPSRTAVGRAVLTRGFFDAL